jgi:hypothetical protein
LSTNRNDRRSTPRRNGSHTEAGLGVAPSSLIEVADPATQINYYAGGGQIPGRPGQGAAGAPELAAIFFMSDWAAAARGVPATAATARPAATNMSFRLGEGSFSCVDVPLIGPE